MTMRRGTVALLPPRAGERFAGFLALAVLLGVVLREALFTPLAAPGASGGSSVHPFPSLLTVGLGLGLGLSVGLLRRERAAHRAAQRDLLLAHYQAETDAEHLRFMLAATAGQPAAPG